MPLYTYRCQDCQAILELLIKNVNLEPSRCGLHCTLQRGDNDDIRGFGELHDVLFEISEDPGSTRCKMLPVPVSALYKKTAMETIVKCRAKKDPEVLDPK